LILVGTEADPTPSEKEGNEILAIVVSSNNTARKNKQTIDYFPLNQSAI
jgi:hypothetical protein